MTQKFSLGNIAIAVVRKDIKNIHLSVYPPRGTVRISAPRRLPLETIRVFTIQKLDWIKQQRRKLQEQERETRRDYLERESHYLWGKRYLLSVIEKDEPPSVTVKGSRIILSVRPKAGYEKRKSVMEEWYRELLKDRVAKLVTKWEKEMRVRTDSFVVRKMKTRWGSCSPGKKTIRVNLDLAKKPRECLEYIVVHELVHFRERLHNDRFVGFMDKYLHKWRSLREVLNKSPLAHEDWKY